MVKIAVDKQTRQVMGFWNPVEDALEEDEMPISGGAAWEPDLSEGEELVELKEYTRTSLAAEIERRANGHVHRARMSAAGELEVEVVDE